MILLFVLAALLYALPAQAACSGSGVTWSCTAGSSVANVNSAISSATDGAVLTFDAGSYTWSGSLTLGTLTKGITLICASVAACEVSMGATIGLPSAGTSSKLYRVSGFKFTGSGIMVWSCPGGNCAATTLSNFRFDHNTIIASSEATLMYFGENGSVDNYIYGVVDHNTVTCSQSCYLAQVINTSSNNATAGALGSANNLFFEDNTITVSSITNDGTGAIDGWGGHGVVWRFNANTNARVLMHGVTHAWGPRNFEVYHNTITHNAGSSDLLENGFRSIHHQGSGTFMFFENVITPVGSISSDAIVTLHYRSWTSGSGSARCDGTVGVDGNRSPQGTYFGYPCKRQPGRDVDAKLFPVYAWRNRTNGGTRIPLTCGGQGESNPETCTHHVVANRDYYNAVSASAQSSSSSPFDGTTGMGYGTLANRPTTCTTNAESADAGNGGVGYWATDQGSWNLKPGGAQGVLYMCSATNTWTVHYTPYQYPHPLVCAQDGGCDEEEPPPPSNKRFSPALDLHAKQEAP